MFTTTLGVIVGLTHLLGYWVYYRASHSEKDPIKPEPASWLIWTFGSFVNLVSYSIVSGDPVKDILPFVCSLACVLIFIDQWFHRGKKFEKISKEGFSMLLLDVGSVIVGFVTMSALVANVSCQIGTIASYIPIMRATAKDPNREKTLPWALWTLAYGLDVILVTNRWEKWEDVVYPLVCFILTLLMTVIVNRNRTP